MNEKNRIGNVVKTYRKHALPFAEYKHGHI